MQIFFRSGTVLCFIGPMCPAEQYARLENNRACVPFYLHGLTLIPAWISNYIHYKVWYENTYSF